MSTECKDTTLKGFGDYTDEQYDQMGKDLNEKINSLIKETENKYCVQPIIKMNDTHTRVDMFILNKHTMYHN